MKTFIVQGEHWHVPGQHMHAFTTMPKAQAKALELVNILREDVELSPATDPAKFEEALLEARRARAEEIGFEDFDPESHDPDINSLGDDDGDVWITELSVDEEG